MDRKRAFQKIEPPYSSMSKVELYSLARSLREEIVVYDNFLLASKIGGHTDSFWTIYESVFKTRSKVNAKYKFVIKVIDRMTSLSKS